MKPLTHVMGMATKLLMEQTTPQGGEDIRFLEHLDLAELTKGSYTGRKGSSDEYEAGTSTIIGKLSDSVILYRMHSAYTGSHNGFQFGKLNGSGWALKGAATAQEIYSIDTKLDDGLANSGSIITQNGNGESGCITSEAYVRTSTSETCRMWFDWQ